MVWSKRLSPSGGVGVEQAALAAGGHRHADGVADALAERAGGRLHAGGVVDLGVAGGLRAPGAQRLQVVELHAVAGEVELHVEGEARVAHRQHEAVARRPVRVARVVPQPLLEEQVGGRRHAHRRPRVAVADLLDGVHRQHPGGVDRPAVEVAEPVGEGRLRLCRAAGGGVARGLGRGLGLGALRHVLRAPSDVALRRAAERVVPGPSQDRRRTVVFDVGPTRCTRGINAINPSHPRSCRAGDRTARGLQWRRSRSRFERGLVLSRCPRRAAHEALGDGAVRARVSPPPTARRSPGPRGCLRRAHQAADHRAPAGDDGAGDDAGRPRLADVDAAARHPGRRDPRRGRGQRLQLLLRPRHRPADAPHAAAAAAHPGRSARGRRWSSASCCRSASIVLLAATTTLLAAALAAGAIFYYAVLYTMVSKRHTRRSTEFGGVPGAAPVLIGWAAVTGSLDWPAARRSSASSSAGRCRTSGRWPCGSGGLRARRRPDAARRGPRAVGRPADRRLGLGDRRASRCCSGR